MTDSPPAAGITYRERAMLKALGEALVRLERRLDELERVVRALVQAAAAGRHE